MKKVIGILFLICVMFSTISFAAYYEDNTIEDIESTENDIQVISVDESEENSENTETYEDSDIIYDDVYKMGEDITINEIIDGNVYVMAKNVKIDGATIYGNLFVMAETIEINDVDIGSSVYLMGKDITFLGMTNDLYIMGENIEIKDGTCVWRNIKSVGQNLILNGYITRNVYAGIDELTVSEGTIIEGSLEYSSQNEANISEEAEIGEIKYTQKIEDVEDSENTSVNVLSYIYSFATALVKTLIIALLIIFFVRKFRLVERTENVTNDLLKKFGKGALVIVLTPLLALILMITLIGLALGISLMAIYIIMLYISISVVSLEIAYRVLLKNKEKEITKRKLIGITLLISSVIWLIGLIPIIGGILKLILILIGLGILFDLMFKKVEKVNNEN